MFPQLWHSNEETHTNLTQSDPGITASHRSVPQFALLGTPCAKVPLRTTNVRRLSWNALPKVNSTCAKKRRLCHSLYVQMCETNHGYSAEVSEALKRTETLPSSSFTLVLGSAYHPTPHLQGLLLYRFTERHWAIDLELFWRRVMEDHLAPPKFH